MKTLKIGSVCLLLLFLGNMLFASTISIHGGVNGVNLIRSGVTTETIEYLGSGVDFLGIFGRRFGFYTNLFLSFLPPFSIEYNNVSIDSDAFFMPLAADLTLGFGGKGEITDSAGILFGFGFHISIIDLMTADSSSSLDAFGWTWGIGGTLVLYYKMSDSMSVNVGANGSYDLLGWSTSYYADESSYYSDYFSFARSLNWNVIAGLGFHF